MTVAGHTPGFYLVAFSLVSVFLVIMERLVTGYHTFPYVVAQAIVGCILIIIAAILTPRWAKNPDNTLLAVATAIVNILLFIIGDVTISSSVLAVALWVVYRSFSMPRAHYRLHNLFAYPPYTEASAGRTGHPGIHRLRCPLHPVPVPRLVPGIPRSRRRTRTCPSNRSRGE